MQAKSHFAELGMSSSHTINKGQKEESLDSDDEVFKPPPKIWLAIDFGADRTNIAVWSK